MNDQSQIQCPNCKEPINVEDVLAKQIKSKFDQELRAREQELEQRIILKQDELLKKELQLKSNEKRQNELLEEAILKREKELSIHLKKRLSDEFELQLKSLQEDADEKAVKLKELQKKELEFLRKEKELIEKSEQVDLEIEKRLKDAREILKKDLTQSIEEQNSFKLKEKDMLIKQLAEKVDDMKRKAEQGSMQVQGEAQELVIEDFLSAKFPFDEVNEIGKGVRGADCIQIIHNQSGKECGKIIYESKRTKSFGSDWAKKLKEDVLRVKGNIGVIVSSVMPDGINGMGMHEGVWVCDFHNLGNLATLLRFAILKEYDAIGQQLNKGDKMEMLYAYLTSEEFKMQMMAIVEGFTSMKENLEKQKRSMNTYWNKQEKEIERVMLSSTSLYGSVKGIAHDAIGTIQQLEMSED